MSPRVRALNGASNLRSLISIPIELGGEVFGVYNLHSIRPRRFSSDDRRLLLALAQRAAVALANARLFEGERLARERLEAAAQHDKQYDALRKAQADFVSAASPAMLDAQAQINAILGSANLSADDAAEAARTVEQLGAWAMRAERAASLPSRTPS